MASLFVVETNQALLGAIPSQVTLLAICITYRARYLTSPTVLLAALGTLALALLAPTRRIQGLLLFSLTFCYLCPPRHPFGAKVQLQLLLTGLLYHLI